MEISQNEIGKILTEKYLLIKQRNNSFSLRSFARKLEVGSGALSRIMAGKRRISFEMANLFSDKLNLSDEEKFAFTRSFHVEKLIENGLEFKSLDNETLFSLSFDHFAFLNLLKTDTFRANTDFIAKRLSLSVEKVVLVMDQLLENKLIFWDEDGLLKRTSANISTPDMQSMDFIRNLQKTNLEKAKESLDLDIEKRDITAMTMTINPNRLDEARKLIRKFQSDLSILLENDEKKEVYKLCVQFFPLSF